MCFQGFVYFACGHDRIYEMDCEISQASQNPYFQKIQCPNYRSQSGRPPQQLCGLARFYCAKTKDGPFLDHAYQIGNRATEVIGQLDQRIAQRELAVQQFAAEATRREIPQESWKTVPAYTTVNADLLGLTHQRERVRKTQLEASTILQQAKAHHLSLRQHQYSGDAGVYPPFVPSANPINRLPAELIVPSYQQGSALQQLVAGGSDNDIHATSNFMQHGTPLQPSYNPYAPQQQTQYPPSPVGSHITVAANDLHYTSTLLPSKAHRIMQEQRAEAQRQYPPMQPPPSILNRKGGRPKKFIRAEDTQVPNSRGRKPLTSRQDSMQEDTDTVRRSARVRGKKVNYAESGGSDSGSRSASPEKSDASGLSLVKSDESTSPSKTGYVGMQQSRELGHEANELRRPSFSLVERISDFKRRNPMAGPGTPSQRREMPGMRDLLNSSPDQPAPHINASISQSIPFAATGGTQLSAEEAAKARNLAAMLAYEAEARAGTQARTPAYPSYGSPVNPYTGQQQIGMPGGFGQPFLYRNQLTPSAPQALPSDVRQWIAQGQMQDIYRPTQPAFPQPTMMRDFASPNLVPFMPAGTNETYVSRNDNTLAPGNLTDMHPQPTMVDSSAMSDSTALPMPVDVAKIHGTRKDSVMAPSENNDTHTPTNNYAYDRMRRSFSSTAALTPPTFLDPGTGNLEPRKRSLATFSSPMLSSNKRMRLSLPGEEALDSNIHGGEVMLGGADPSASPKVPHQEMPADAPWSATDVPESGFDMIATSAPVLPPTAWMYPYAEQGGGTADDGVAEDDLGEAPSQMPQEGDDAEVEHEGQGGMVFADIDWDAVNNGTVGV